MISECILRKRDVYLKGCQKILIHDCVTSRTFIMEGTVNCLINISVRHARKILEPVSPVNIAVYENNK